MESRKAVGVVVTRSRGGYAKRCVGVVTGYSPGVGVVTGYSPGLGFAGLSNLDPTLIVTCVQKIG